jgi:Family of unknown function (DUF6527)
VREGKRDAVAHLVESLFEGEGRTAGAFKWTGLHGVDDPGPFGIMFRCPCGCNAIHGAGFDNRPPGHQPGTSTGWHWDGNRDKPTLTPSLGLGVSHDNTVGPDGVYHWHGFLRAGVFEEC